MKTSMARRLALASFACLLCPADSWAQPKIVAYVTSWAGSLNEIQYGKVTHLNYSFLNPNNGIAVANVPNHPKLQGLVSSGHASGKKVLLAVGGWTNLDNHAFESYAASESGRTTFTNAMMTIVNHFGLDGIDIDWEYPTWATSENYRAFMQRLCSTLHSSGKLCTAAVAARGGNADTVPTAVFGYVDYLNLMAYDGGAGPSHSPYSFAVSTMDYWRGRGLPAGKAVLGVPFYGRGTNFSTYENYRAIVARDPGAPNRDVSNGVYYNGIPTIQAKTDLAQQRGGGVMFWEIAGDTTNATSLLSAIHARLGGGGGDGISTTAWYNVVNQNSGKCADAAGSGTANGTRVHQWACHSGLNQQWQFRPTDGGYYKLVPRHAATLGWDVTGGPGATGSGVKLQLWTVGANPGANQQWQPVSLGNGQYRFVARHSGKCLDVPGASTADGVQLQQWDCNGSGAQAFRLVQR